VLIDSHAHIQGKEYDKEVEAVIERARGVGVEKIIAVGGAGDMSSNTDAIALADSFHAVYATVGMHPHDAKDVGIEELETLRGLTTHPKVVAVGETGLDYYYNHSSHELQEQVFSSFIHMACETGLPIVVHERDAAEKAAELLRQEGNGKLCGVIHCFTGNYQAARAYLDLGFYLSFTGIITFKNAEPLRAVVRQIPLDRILVETDAPYLAPVPYRGKENESSYLIHIAQKVADLHAMSIEQVAEITTANSKRIFGI